MYEGLMLFVLYMFMMWLNIRGEKLIWGIMGILIPVFAWMQAWWPVELAVFMMLTSVIVLGVKIRGGV